MNAGHPNVGVQAIVDQVRTAGLKPQVVDVRRGEALHSHPEAVIGTGGPGSPVDGGTGIDATQDLLRHCIDAGVPVLGICFTFQLLCLGHGATVRKLRRPLMGIVELSGRSKDRWLGRAGKGPVFENRTLGVFGESDCLPLETQGEQVIAARFGDQAVGCAFHPEAATASVTAFLDQRTAIQVDPMRGDVFSRQASRLEHTRDLLLGGFLESLRGRQPA